MAAMAFDTHASVKSLTAAGMSETQAEAITSLIKDSRDADLSNLATKTDLAETKADILKSMIGMIAGAVVVNAVTVMGRSWR
jgi:hypothetical protein